MRLPNYFIGLLAVSIAFTGCKSDDPSPTPPGAGTSETELLVEKFTSAPTVDGNIDGMWNNAQKLVGKAVVPDLGARNTYLNSDGAGVEENLGLFDPFSNDEYNVTLRSGYFGSDIFFLMEWDDAEDSKDSNLGFLILQTKCGNSSTNMPMT